jgi:hypothetical protein
MDLKSICYEDENLINQVKGSDQWWAVPNTDMNLRILRKADNVLASTVTINFSRTLFREILAAYLPQVW